MVDFFLENGKINITLGSERSTATGTSNNDAYQEIKNKIDNEIDRIVADELVEYIFDKTKNRNKNNTKMIDALKYFKDHDYYLTYNDAIKGSLIKTLFPDGNKDEIDRFLQRLNQNIYVEVYGTNDQNMPHTVPYSKNTPLSSSAVLTSEKR